MCLGQCSPDTWQRVLNAAARVVSSTHKYDRGLSRLLHSELHCLDVPERVQYKLGVVVYSYLHGQSPRYLADLCVPVSDVSASLGGFSRCRLSTLGPRAFSVAGPSFWKSTRPLERSGSWQGQLQTFAEDASIFTVLIEAFSILKMFRRIRSTNLLTYKDTTQMLFLASAQLMSGNV